MCVSVYIYIYIYIPTKITKNLAVWELYSRVTDMKRCLATDQTILENLSLADNAMSLLLFFKRGISTEGQTDNHFRLGTRPLGVVLCYVVLFLCIERAG